VNKNYRLLRKTDRIIIVLVTDTLYYKEGNAQKLIPIRFPTVPGAKLN